MCSMMEALQLVSFNDEGQAMLHEENFQSVFGHNEVRNRQVVVIAAAGSFRRGKSFFLNYLIRFLKTQGDKSFTAADRVSGFEWKHGLERVTTGICIWPEVFFINDLAVVLIDTQGTFDKNTSMKVNTAVVAFSALISSVQIFNYHERFDSQDFMNLEFFMKYGSLLQRDNFNQHGQKFFQKLLFLIRDWNHEQEYPYGYNGGNKYLTNFVTTDNVNVDEEFLDHMHSLAASLLLPGHLVPKRIAGDLVTGSQLIHHIRACISLFNSNELPEPKTIYDNKELESVNEMLRTCFDKVDCYLMPHPGDVVSSSVKFNGHLKGD
ncbi:hypothetical protein B566_EDAN001640 [Ephemera danica]|nr:hypothetical protein B566_EDAN001640 [Ephemera danica]